MRLNAPLKAIQGTIAIVTYSSKVLFLNHLGAGVYEVIIIYWDILLYFSK